MKTRFFPSAVRIIGLSLCAGAALALSVGVAQARPGGGGGGGATCTIATSPTPAVIDEGQSVDFTGTVSGKSPRTYSWTFGGGSPGTSSNQNETVLYATAGSYTATLDGTNGKGDACSTFVPVTVNVGGGNTPPTADANGPYSGTAGIPVQFDGSGSSDPDGAIVSYQWDFGDGGTGSGVQPSYVYASAGNYAVSLTVTDNDGATGSDTSSANIGSVGNTPPVADANGPYSGTIDNPVTFDGSGSNDPDGTIVSYDWDFGDGNTGSGVSPTHTYTAASTYTVSLTVTDDGGATDSAASSATITDPGANGPTARGDTYATPVGKTLNVAADRVSGVLYNDFGGTPPLTAELVSGPASGSLSLNSDGSFSYTPNASLADNDNDSFVYRAVDGLGNPSGDTTVNINILSDQPDFKIFMNYELGMHCTGFEFAYCCVLPPYNSILAQVVKPNKIDPDTNAEYARLLEGDHNNADALGRSVVMRDFELDGSGNFKKYFLEYYHDAQPRREGQGKEQGPDTLISAVEGNSLFYHQTLYDSAATDGNGALQYGPYEGVDDVVQGDGDFNDPTDNYANGWLNHFYIFADPAHPTPAGPNLEGHNSTGTTLEADKIRLGVTGHVEYPADVGAALQPMGPTGSAAGFDNVLTFSGDTGTVVYTQMKVLENLPVMLTSPGIWEALGLPLTPFEDSINFFGDPGAVDEDSIRPYVAMKARLHEASCDADGLNCTQGGAVIGSNGHPVIGFGTAPIDIPNCERCHSVPAMTDGQPNHNSPSFIRSDYAFPHAGNFAGATLDVVTDAEYQFWNAYYDIVPGIDSDWYSRLKGAAINMLSLHDFDQGTGFTSNWPAVECTDPLSACSYTNGLADLTDQTDVPQNTRLGKESVICQKCHADNVIAVVKSATIGGTAIKPISEAIHWRHRETSEGGSIDFADAAGRSGGCQGCHPAHRSDGVMDGYPITLGGDNEQADGDNRLALGGCFVGRDVHSNPLKDVDGAETPEYLNAVGQWLSDNVFHNQDGEAGIAGSPTRGLWCTNCHTQLGQEIWAAEDCNNLITGDCVNDVRGLGSLSEIATAIGSNIQEVESWLDPKDNVHGLTPDGIDHSHRIWDPAVSDAMLATIEVGPGGPVVTLDGDGDPSVNILSFCTTDDCVARINANKGDQTQWRYPANPFIDTANDGVAVPFSAATDGRDHWLSPGEPHCADCHAAPYVEQSGNINAYPPFNYPAKASLMRYSKGHQGVTCQGCHESIHGLYPVTPTIDSTSYAQAAALNHDGSHGPLKCGTCHQVNGDGVPSHIQDGLTYNGQPIVNDYDAAVSWMHTFTADADPRDDYCLNCHEDNRSQISSTNKAWAEHSFKGRSSREMMDVAEELQLGHLAGDPAVEPPETTVCTACHGDRSRTLQRRGCTTKWKDHLVQGRASELVWEYMSETYANSNCGW